MIFRSVSSSVRSVLVLRKTKAYLCDRTTNFEYADYNQTFPHRDPRFCRDVLQQFFGPLDRGL